MYANVCSANLKLANALFFQWHLKFIKYISVSKLVLNIHCHKKDKSMVS